MPWIHMKRNLRKLSYTKLTFNDITYGISFYQVLKEKLTTNLFKNKKTQRKYKMHFQNIS